MISSTNMRRLDRWLGVPLCWLASRLPRRHSSDSGTPRRVVFIELAEMGSAVLATPAVCRARKRFGADVWFVTFDVNRDALTALGVVPEGHVVTLRTDTLAHFLQDTLQCVRTLRRAAVDTVVDLELFTRFSALLGFASGARRHSAFDHCGGPGLYRGHLATHRVTYSPHRHMAHNYLALVAALEASGAGPPLPKITLGEEQLAAPQAPYDPAAAAHITRLLTNAFGPRCDALQLVVLNPHCGAHLPQRRWPLERFAALGSRLLAETPGRAVVVIGAASDRARSRRLAAALPAGRVLDLSGRLDIAGLLALYARAALLVSNDSGPAHFGPVGGVPTLVLFGPETPALFAPLGAALTLTADLGCAPCVSAFNQRQTACRDNRCMQAIDVGSVLGAARRLLAGERLARVAAHPTAGR